MRLQGSRTKNVDITLVEVVAEARAGISEPLAQVMRAHNQRLFRIARSILRDHGEAEDIVQDTFIKAFTNADDLRDESKIAAWLGKITVNLARDRSRQIARRAKIMDFPDDLDVVPINIAFQEDRNKLSSPERQAAMGDVRRMIEQEIDTLPQGFREVFVMRVIEQMSIDETADILALNSATVKTRLHRAKSLLREALRGRLDTESLNVFPFGGVHCARTTETVINYLKKKGEPDEN